MFLTIEEHVKLLILLFSLTLAFVFLDPAYSVINKSTLLTFAELNELSEKERAQYLREVSRALATIKEPKVNKSNSYFSMFLNFFKTSSVSRAPASTESYRCIGGGVPVRLEEVHEDNPREQNCGTNSYAGYTCQNPSHEICNPLLFGISASGNPVCYPNATTNLCYRTTRPGVVEQFPPQLTDPNRAEEYNAFVEEMNKVCPTTGGDPEVTVYESSNTREEACLEVHNQTRINRDRLGGSSSAPVNVVLSDETGGDSFVPSGLQHDIAAAEVEDRSYTQRLVKMNQAAGLGECLPAGVPGDIEGLFERNNINPYMGANPRSRGRATGLTPLSGNTNPRITALARVVAAYDRIGGGALRSLKEGSDIEVVFANNRSTATLSRRIGQQIQLTPGNQNMTGTAHTSTCGGVDNIGLIAHEIAHYVGGSDNQRNYNAFLRAMGGRQCMISNYADNNLGEHFAEVAAAYLTMPHAFRGKGESCRRAFNFMKELFNEPEMTMSCEARRNSYSLSSAPETSLRPQPRPRPAEAPERSEVLF